jgi:hypothetical protein
MSDGLARVLFATVFFILGDYVGVQGAINFGRKSRGTACYADESTEELRQCAIDDYEQELADSDFTVSPFDLSHCRR